MKSIFKNITLCVVIFAMSILSSVVLGKDVQHSFNWNQFRGPNGDGVSTSSNLPTEFSGIKNVQWRTAIHDLGWSSPVVWKDQVWVTTARKDGSELFALCVNLETGKIMHDIKVFDVVIRKTNGRI
jgi:hypothetical protein